VRPIGIGRLRRAGLAGGERGLQDIGAFPAERFGAGLCVEAPADQEPVPARAILERDQVELFKPERIRP
jgi:hypothetical protein